MAQHPCDFRPFRLAHKVLKRAAMLRPVTPLLLSFVCSAFASGLLGCSAVEAPETVAVERHPLGKADAAGSCRDGDGDHCGGQSAGVCWCDDECVKFGDCCGDRAAVCEATIGREAAEIDSAATFDALAFSGDGGLIMGKSVKFLVDARDPNKPQVHFMNANFPGGGDAAKYHYAFAREVLDIPEGGAEFNEVTYFTQDKRYFAGTIAAYRTSADAPILYGIQFYPQDVIAEDAVFRGVAAVRERFDLADARVAFVATGSQQTAATVTDALAKISVENLTIDGVLGQLDVIPMQVGEAWGYLRIFPTNIDALSATDIPVFAELPLDLSVVAGTITKTVQDASSHVNLKAKERGTPNLVIRSAGPDHSELKKFVDRPVHLTVSAEGFTLEPATDDEVAAKLAERMNKPWVELHVDPTAEITAFSAMCPESAEDCLDQAASFGNKAGNLGFLVHPSVLGTAADAGSLSAKLGYDASPAGVGVPVRMYQEVVAFAPNSALRDAITQLIAAERAGTLSPLQRADQLAAVRQLFLDAELPATLVPSVIAAAKAELPSGTKSVKIRSSSNAEDIAGFDGAGLYDSFRGDFDAVDNPEHHCTVVETADEDLEVSPRTVACAMKGVYASLWNKRAVEERTFARLDHSTSAMGLAVVARYKERGDIAANSVVITRVLNSSGVFGYTFSTQKGNNVVTNPKKGTVAENVIAAFLAGEPTAFTVTRFATPKANKPALTTTVMTEAQMQTLLDITTAVEIAYCKAADDYYTGSCSNVVSDVEKPRALDFEFKLYENGEFLCKQVREFSGQ